MSQSEEHSLGEANGVPRAGGPARRSHITPQPRVPRSERGGGPLWQALRHVEPSLPEWYRSMIRPAPVAMASVIATKVDAGTSAPIV